MAKLFARERPSPAIVETLSRQNKPEGYMCSSCAWGKPAHPHAFEFCENGAKSTIWELTRDRCTPEFFAEHTRRGTADVERFRSGDAGPSDHAAAL